MNFDSFSHGQITSKLWLCNNLQPYISPKSNIAILGGWYNVLGFLLMIKFPYIKHISNFDINCTHIEIADKINITWLLSNQVKNIMSDVNTIDLKEFDIVINCSPEHIESNKWFENISKGTLVCIQSSDITDKNEPWLVCNPNENLTAFKEKYPINTSLFTGELDINYNDWGYKRLMIIGQK